MSSQKMAAMLIIIVTTALKLVYINILMFKNYTEFMLETHEHFSTACGALTPPASTQRHCKTGV